MLPFGTVTLHAFHTASHCFDGRIKRCEPQKKTGLVPIAVWGHWTWFPWPGSITVIFRLVLTVKVPFSIRDHMWSSCFFLTEENFPEDQELCFCWLLESGEPHIPQSVTENVDCPREVPAELGNNSNFNKPDFIVQALGVGGKFFSVSWRNCNIFILSERDPWSLALLFRFLLGQDFFT